ncbi:variant erythrocyte surface antigen-1 family protein [Babesia caballi]|uniref:Variant erythrocyte surface antigen-1 family protein n=1 Tax=Babesia caballi TaxID=5871 RepID=A0AAV4M0G6_BABCB|nr:variant erythrocyte surface antigen-1 family protein [Babesia caballi]
MLPLDIPLSACVVLFFDCPSNLKEAIDWILRVTGKDGGEEFEKVKNALTQGTDQNGLIDTLADGLQQFIGYKQGGIGTIEASKGIGRSSEPRDRLGDAHLGFIAKVLEQLITYSGQKYGYALKLMNYIPQLTSAIKELTNGMGGGVYKFEEAIQKAEEVLKNVTSNEISDVWNTLKIVDDILTKLPSIKSNITVRKLADAVKSYLGAVLQQLKQVQGIKSSAETEVSTLKSNIDTLLTQLQSQNGNKPFNFGKDPVDGQTGLKQHVDAVVSANNALSGKLGRISGPVRYVVSAVISGTSQFLSQLQKIHYASYYQGVTVETSGWQNGQSEDAKKCAKIFLGCVPMLFNALSFLYWNCSHGAWKTMTLGGNDDRLDLMWFMYSMAYGSSSLSRSKQGKDVAITACKKFEDFKKAMKAAQEAAQKRAEKISQARSGTATAFSTAKPTYADFLNGLKQKWTESSTDYALSSLYYCASCYFKSIQIKNSNDASTTPSTIRQMLYFLAALPFTEEIDKCEKHIENLLQKPIPISMAGLNTKPLFLTADNINSHLTTTLSMFATATLGRLQGPKDEADPFLHSLYSNGMGLHSPSGAALFRKVAECVYAVQFQMKFLLKQCNGKYFETCGWRDCRYGSTMNPQNGSQSLVLSHICGGYKCKRTRCTHKNSGNQCNHNSYDQYGGCGHSAATPSPIQAFLTDNLKGFHVSQQPNPLSLNHLDNHTPGSICHVKLGFSPATLRKDETSKGYHIYVTLSYICSSATSPFRQFNANVLCLAKRTPRILGEFFGFYWQVVAARQNSSVLSEIMAYITDVFLQDADKKHFIVALSNMNGSDKSHVGQHPADLLSLYYPKCSGSNCGPYLFPLVYSTATVFSPKYASTYLSWLLYLADDFRDWLIEFLERFDGLKCEGCHHSCQSHSSGSHASACRCPSITQCADVLPLFYEYGFTILDAKKLKDSKKQCSAFANQLAAVIRGKPLSDVLSAIDKCLYMFRFYFFYNVSAFWTVYLCLLLYFILFGIDVLHIKSHLRLPSSHGIPSITLLTAGESPSVTKLTYFTRDLT